MQIFCGLRRFVPGQVCSAGHSVPLQAAIVHLQYLQMLSVAAGQDSTQRMTLRGLFDEGLYSGVLA